MTITFAPLKTINFYKNSCFTPLRGIPGEAARIRKKIPPKVIQLPSAKFVQTFQFNTASNRTLRIELLKKKECIFFSLFR